MGHMCWENFDLYNMNKPHYFLKKYEGLVINSEHMIKTNHELI